MNQNKMLKGYEKMMFNLSCPYCGNEESVEFDQCVQYETFELISMNDDGTYRIWCCQKCGNEFYTELD